MGKEVTCWDKMGEMSGLNNLKSGSELAEDGQALWHDGKWAMSSAALGFLHHFCFNSPLQMNPAERQQVWDRRGV